MDWKSERTRRLTRQMQLVYIESELKNYYWHLAEWQRYENQLQGLKKRYQEELEHPSCSSSIIRMPDGSGNSRKIVEVVIERMQFLGDSKKKEESAYPYQEPPQTYQKPQSYTGQAQYQQQTFPYTAGGNFGDDSLDLQSDEFLF